MWRGFETLPDAPITGVAVDLTTGPRSLLGANGVLCKEPLRAPTTIIAQSGAKGRSAIAPSAGR